MHLCKGPPSPEDLFVLDHNHLDGSPRGICHNSCNLNYKPEKAINVLIHNAKNYDTHLILSHANPEKHGAITCIPRTTEQYVSFRIGNLIFKDSMQFLNKGLDELVSTMDKVELCTTSKFLKNYIRKISDNPGLLDADTLGLYNKEIPDETFEMAQLGVYFYEYVTSTAVLEETELPDQEDFYSRLTGEGITDEEYERASAVWDQFHMKSLWNYHDLYLIMDVLLLADVLLKFQKVCHRNYGIDPLHSYTTPGFGWQSLLKMTGVELQLFSEEEKELYLFFEAAKRGGLSTISRRYQKANIPGRADFDPSKPNKWIMYWDANNLYVSFL